MASEVDWEGKELSECCPQHCKRVGLLTDEEVLVLVVVRHEFLLLYTKLLKQANYSGHRDTSRALCIHSCLCFQKDTP